MGQNAMGELPKKPEDGAPLETGHVQSQKGFYEDVWIRSKSIGNARLVMKIRSVQP
ncbi:hypothetical protein GCM10028791_44280 [Echinicola sediminis]